MSTYYLPKKVIPFQKIKRGLDFTSQGVHVTTPPTKKNTDKSIVLHDGKDYLWAFEASNGGTSFSRYGGNCVEDILDALGRKFRTAFVSEYEEEFAQLADSQYVGTYISIVLG